MTDHPQQPAGPPDAQDVSEPARGEQLPLITDSEALAAAGVVGGQQRALAALTGISGLYQGILDGHQEQLDELLAWKDQVQEAGNQIPVPASARMRWEDLTPAEAAHAWHRLIAWVGWAVQEFDLADSLPACWYLPEHGRLRWELSALMLAYEEMYRSARASKGGELTWMAWLYAAQNRWHAYHLTAAERTTLLRFFRAQPDLHTIVAVHAPYVASGQEAARARCLTEIARRVAAHDIQWMIMDNRDKLVRGSPVVRAEAANNTRDERTLKRAKNAGIVPANLQLTFRDDRDEILLALPDIVGFVAHSSLASGHADRMAPLTSHIDLVEAATVIEATTTTGDRRPPQTRKGRPATHPQPEPTPPPPGLPDRTGSEPAAASPPPRSHTAHTRSTGLRRELAYHLAAAEAQWLTAAHRHIQRDIRGIYAQAGTADENTLQALEDVRVRLAHEEPRLRQAATAARNHASTMLSRIHHPPVLPSVLRARDQLEQADDDVEIDHNPSFSRLGSQNLHPEL